MKFLGSSLKLCCFLIYSSGVELTFDGTCSIYRLEKSNCLDEKQVTLN